MSEQRYLVRIRWGRVTEQDVVEERFAWAPDAITAACIVTDKSAICEPGWEIRQATVVSAPLTEDPSDE